MLPATEQALNRQCTDRHDDVAFLVSMTPAENINPVLAMHAWLLIQEFRGLK